MNEKMKEKHRIAAREIFEDRNSWKELMDRGMLDLHGLHVAEAAELLNEIIPEIYSAGLKSICIITGSGHHSKGSNFKARLLPSVERFCQEWRLPYELLADTQGHVGMIRVSMASNYLGKPSHQVAYGEQNHPQVIVIK